MIALANLGSATSTSFTSRGRSTTMDFPMPSGTKRALASLLTSRRTGSAASVAGARVAAQSEDAAIAANNAVLVSVRCAIVGFLVEFLFHRCHGGDAESDQTDTAAGVLRVAN